MTAILQSCLETQQFIETKTLNLKGAPTKTSELIRSSSYNYPTEINNKAMPHNIGGKMSPDHDSHGWSFLQVLSNVSLTPKETMEKENVYVHPLTKQYSSSRLSEKSLELCTENLGSETGSDIVDISILSLSPSNSSTGEVSWLKQDEKLPEEVESSSAKYKVNNSRKFPPPLTTISGLSSLQFRPHRQDGRLVIQAVESPPKHTYFRAERSHGRLRLSFLKDEAIMLDSKLTTTEGYDVDDSEDDYEVDADGESDYEDEDDYQLQEDEEEDEEEEEEEMVEYLNGDMADNIFDFEVEMEIERFQRPMNSRCNDGGHGNKGLCDWTEPLWVVTS